MYGHLRDFLKKKNQSCKHLGWSLVKMKTNFPKGFYKKIRGGSYDSINGSMKITFYTKLLYWSKLIPPHLD